MVVILFYQRVEGKHLQERQNDWFVGWKVNIFGANNDDTRIIQQQLTIYSGFESVILKQIKIPSLVIIDNLILNGVVDIRPLQCWRHWDFEDFWAPAEPFGIYLIYFHSLTHLNSLQVLSGSFWSIRYWHLWWCDYRIFEITEMLSALMWLKPAILVSLAKTLGYCWKIL